MKFLKYWEINGTRRPFPPITEACKRWGERVFYPQPQYVEPKHCRWCGKELSGRRTSFCCDECSIAFNNVTVWNRGRDSYSLRILYRDNFTCQDCGEFNAFKNEHGIFLQTMVILMFTISNSFVTAAEMNPKTLLHYAKVVIKKDIKGVIRND